MHVMNLLLLPPSILESAPQSAIHTSKHSTLVLLYSSLEYMFVPVLVLSQHAVVYEAGAPCTRVPIVLQKLKENFHGTAHTFPFHAP